jgi:signal transduction histidine kinase
MESYKQHVPILDFLYKKPNTNSPGFSEAPEDQEELQQAAFDDLQYSKLELHERMEQLQARNQELEAYASTVAHDLKEPLAVMVLTANLITKIQDLRRDELREYLQQIKSTAYQMNTTVNSLLLFAKVSRAEAPMERVDMGWVVKNVRERLSHLIDEHQAQLDLPPSWPDAIGYAPWLEEVWANYISNALQHGGRPPRVELGASSQPDGMVRFWTRDNGPGLPPDDQGRLFKPFSQVNSLNAAGQGLGLSIAFRIVEKLGGQVGVESEVGKGCQFFFTLPAEVSSRTVSS